MLTRLKLGFQQFAVRLRLALIALLAILPGCDRKPTWRGVSTDAGNAEHSQNADAIGNISHGDY